WAISSVLHNITWVLKDAQLPVSRSTWKSGKLSANLTLTSCTEEEFACDNGDCIKFTDICDGMLDCEDKSDEKECKMVFPVPGYNPAMPPIDVNGPLKIEYYPYVYSFEDINTIDGSASLDSYIDFTYRDLRLKFKNINTYSNTIDCDSIWIPELHLIAGNWDGFEYDVEIYSKFCSIVTDTGWSPELSSDLKDYRMGKDVLDNIFVYVTYMFR
ncbi:unnamed protein product, partial [Meganyctiphanes norvegica]